MSIQLPSAGLSSSAKSPRLTVRSSLLALLFLAPLPSIGVYFAAFANESQWGSIIWACAKIGLFVGPALCWFMCQKQALAWPTFHWRGIGVGLLSGFALGGIIFLSYWLVARPVMSFDALRGMLIDSGIDSVEKYLLLSLYLTLVNSLIEEYVFRWFFYMQLKTVMSAKWAVLASAMIFTFHHSLVLTAYVPWYFNVLASVGVFTGGLVWSYLYYRYQQIWPSYLSHIGADVGVFAIGYVALF